MIVFTTPFIQVYVLLLALTAGVSGMYIPELEPRVIGGAAARTVVRTAVRGARGSGIGATTVRGATRNVRLAPITPPAPAPKPQGVGFLGKIGTASLVGFGMHGATQLDEKLSGGEKRDLEDGLENLEARTRVVRAGLQLAAGAARAASRPAVRQAIPHSFPNPMPPVKAPSILAKAKPAIMFTGLGLTAGAGEMIGGKVTGNLMQNLHGDGPQDGKRELDEELFVRNVAAVRAAAKISGAAVRAGARTARTPIAQALPRPAPAPVAPQTKMRTAKLFGTFLAAGTVENSIQTVDGAAVDKIKKDPKGSITKMVSGPLWNRPGEKRELDDDEDLMTRDAATLGYIEELVARASLDTFLENFE